MLLQNDQLRARIRSKSIFVDFEEAPITFPPTYKFDLGTNIYDTSEKMRVPSWTDRILFRGQNIEAIAYNSVPIDTSDHKPVTGVFSVPVLHLDPEKARSLEADIYSQMVNLMDIDAPVVSVEMEDAPPLPPRPISP